MDDLALAHECYNALGGKSLIVYRAFNDREDRAWRIQSAQQYANELMHPGYKHIWRYILNEPDAEGDDLKNLLKWLCDVMDILAANGYKAIVGNFGPATFEPHEIESGIFDEYLKKLGYYSDRGMHYGGWHEYTGILLPFGVGTFSRDDLQSADRVQPSRWAAKVDIKRVASYQYQEGRSTTLPPFWHFLRSTWFDIRAKAIGASVHKKLITEFGWDRMPDLAVNSMQFNPNIYDRLTSRFGIPAPHNTIRGFASHRNVWSYYWPTWSFEEATMKQLEWADKIYPKENDEFGKYVGFNLFTWSLGATDWDRDYGFNFSPLANLHGRMIAYARAQRTNPVPPVPAPVYPSLPADTDTGWKSQFVKPKATYTNVRQHPTTSSPVVGKIEGETNVQTHIAKSSTQADGIWIPVRTSGFKGWIRSDVFETVTPPVQVTQTFTLTYSGTDANKLTIAEVLALLRAKNISVIEG